MALPSKESIRALRLFLGSNAGQEIMNHMRANPPAVEIDPSVHVYAHSNGIRVGWQKFADYLENMDAQPPPQRQQSDRIGDV